MSFFSRLKRNSRMAIRGNYGRAALILLLLIGVGLVIGSFLTIATITVNGGLPGSNPTMEREQTDHQLMMQGDIVLLMVIQAVNALFGIFLLTPLSLGVMGWYLSVAKGTLESFGSIFGFFERAARYLGAVWYSVNMAVRTMFWAALFFAAPAASLLAGIQFEGIYLGGGDRRFAILSALGYSLGAFLALLAVLLYSAYMSKYFLAAYLMAHDENLSVFAAIRVSAKLTRGHRFSLLWYTLSFFGWALLSLIPGVAFYTKPYMQTSFAMYAYYLIDGAGRQEPLPGAQEMTREFSKAEQPEQPAQAAEQPTTQIDPPRLEWQDVQQPEPEIPGQIELTEPPQQPEQSQTEQKSDRWPYI